MGPSTCANSASGVAPSGPDPHDNLKAKYKIMAAGYRPMPRAVCRMTEIGSSAKLIFGSLLEYIQEYGDGKCFPSVLTLAKESGLSIRTTQRAIKELMALPHVKDIKKGQPVSIPSRLKEAFLTREKNRVGTFDYTLTIPEWVIDKYSIRSKKGGDKVSRSDPTRGDKVSPPKGKGHDKVSYELEVRERKASVEYGVRPPVERRADPSSLSSVATHATKLSREAKDKLARKRFEKIEALRASNTPRCDQWGGKKFYDYLRTLCAQHDIVIADMLDHSKSTPEAYGHQMNDIIASCDARGITKQNLVHMLERLVKEWNAGASDTFSTNGKLAIYLIRKHFVRLVEMYGPKETETPEASDDVFKNAKKLSDITVDLKAQEKKEDHA